MISRDLVDSESDLHGDPIARAGIGIIANARNRVAALAQERTAARVRGRRG